MAKPTTLERLPMTMGYFRLILRCFGQEGRRAAILDGTGVSEEDLVNAGAEISLFQQVRQVENVTAACGEGWALSQPELWNPSAHGAIGIAVLSAPTVGEGVEALRRYGHVRAPFFKLHIVRQRDLVRLEYELTVPLQEPQWRPMMEIAFVAVRSLLAAALGRAPHESCFEFAAARPAYIGKLRAALGEHVSFDHAINTIIFPKAWLTIPSALTDASLYRNALAELAAAFEHIETSVDLRAKVERLLQTMPDGRLGADAVARALGVSRRTLTRRLQDSGVQFRDLLDGELKKRAGRLLQAGTLTRPEMAERLGYRDPTSFSRACRRWFSESA
jgi:AraC-like DNA-binding protein